MPSVKQTRRLFLAHFNLATLATWAHKQKIQLDMQAIAGLTRADRKGLALLDLVKNEGRRMHEGNATPAPMSTRPWSALVSRTQPCPRPAA